MNKREYIDRLLALCPESYNDMFNRMYPDGPKPKQVKWATTQVENSVKGLSRVVERNTESSAKSARLLMEHEVTIANLASELKASKTEANQLRIEVENLSTDPDAVATADVQARLNLLEALENGGVDNWEWYSESIADYEKSN